MRNYNSRDSTEAKKQFKTVLIILLTLGILSTVGSAFLPVDKTETKAKLTSIDVDETSFDNVLFAGEELDISTLKADVAYSDGSAYRLTYGQSGIYVKQDVDTSTPGVKYLNVGFGSLLDAVPVYVADRNGLSSDSVDGTKGIYTSDLGYVNVIRSSGNLLPVSFGYVRTDTSFPSNSMQINDDGSISLVTDGSKTTTFSTNLYKGAPIVPNEDGGKIRLTLAGAVGSEIYVKFNFWRNYSTDKLKQITVRGGQSIDIDLSELAEATLWEIVICVGSGKSVDTTALVQLELIDEITNEGVLYTTPEGFLFKTPTKVERVSAVNGIVTVTRSAGEVVYVYAKNASSTTAFEKIYKIK